MYKRMTFILGTLFSFITHTIDNIYILYICDRNVCLFLLFFLLYYATFISPLRYFYIEKCDGVPSDMCDTISDLNLLYYVNVL